MPDDPYSLPMAVYRGMPTDDSIKRAVLIPVFDEVETIACVIDAVRRHFPGDVIVVDDGSTDGTDRVLAARDDVTTVHFARNLGYGAALIAGFALAHEMGVDHLVTMDCDGQHEPAHLPDFFHELLQGGDIVSGSRYLPASTVRGMTAPPDRMEVNRRITELIDRDTGWNLTDAFCGFKGYRMAALAKLELTEHGYAFPLELWAKAYRASLAVREIPVDRIYLNVDRSFGAQLDDVKRREQHYRDVWQKHFRGYSWAS